MSTSSAAGAIEGLEPKAVWRVFAGMAAVPRPSKKEERIRRHMLDVAKRHGFTAREDAVGNIVIDVPATPGHESAPITVMQGHLDMVCEKNAGTQHDFDNDPIQLIIDKDAQSGEPIVRANETTLGADNGIGVALALAAATSDDVVHGPLELLLTLDEEAGMTGAKALSAKSFRGRRLLNLDSEEDDAIYIGCAGGCDSTLTWQLDAGQPSAGHRPYRVNVSGLRGGHSGGDIHEGRGSAIKLLTRVLLETSCDSKAASPSLQIAEFAGGQVRNAIPREAHATVLLPENRESALRQVAEQVRAQGAADSGEPELCITVEPAPADAAGNPSGNVAVLSAADSGRILNALAALPHGVLGMHPKVPNLVETSNNIATVNLSSATNGIVVTVGTLSRSSSESRLQETLTQITSVARLAGADIDTANEYPGWNPDPDSALLASCRRVYSELFGTEPHVMAIHAGLECGLIGKQVGDMDMVSFGPRIVGAHSPDERVYIDSVKKTWKYLCAVLAELARV